MDCGRSLVSWFTERPHRFAVYTGLWYLKPQQISDCGQSRLWQAVYIFDHAVSGISYGWRLNACSQESVHMNKRWLPASLSHNNIPVFSQSFLCCRIICSAVCSAYEIWHTFSHLLTPCVECMCVCRPIFWPTFLSRVNLTLSWLNVTLGLLLLLVLGL